MDNQQEQVLDSSREQKQYILSLYKKITSVYYSDNKYYYRLKNDKNEKKGT